MISPLRNKQPPYTLPSNIIFFFDWRYVHHGAHSSWLTADGDRRRRLRSPLPAPIRPALGQAVP